MPLVFELHILNNYKILQSQVCSRQTMNRCLRALSLKSSFINQFEYVSFRSIDYLAPKSFNFKKMSSSKTLEQLRAKSSQANDLIAKLQHQINQIKLHTTPEKMAERAVHLQNENEQLKKQVEQLKKELEMAESRTAVASGGKPLVNVTNTVVKTEQLAQAAAAQPQKQAQQAQAGDAKPKEHPQKQQKQQQQQQGEKKSKEEAKKKEEVVPQDVNVSCLDFRVGKIVKCEKHPDADSLYVEQIDFGEGKLRNVCSGLVKFIPLDQMQNRMVVCLCNLKASKLRGVMSEAMVMCASTAEKVEILSPPPGAAIGDRVTVAGYEDTPPVAELNQKNNIFGLVAPDLSVNDSMVACYKGVPMEVKGKGPVKSETLKGVPVK